MKLQQFKHELRLNYKCDKWAEIMGAWFECAAHLWIRGENLPASELNKILDESVKETILLS